MICLHCEKEIPMNNVQQGGMHMVCYNEQIEVYKICLAGTCYFDTEFPEEHEQYLITPARIARGIFMNLPDFEGF